MRRLLNSPIAKRPSYDSAQFKCPRCDREITLLGRSQDRSRLRTPKCKNTAMERVFYAENIKEPGPAMVAKLDEAKGSWAIVNVVPGNSSKHAERPEGASPELANRGYEYSSQPHDPDSGTRLAPTRTVTHSREVVPRDGEILADAIKRGLSDGTRMLQSGRNPRR